MALAPAVQASLNSGLIRHVDLVRFDFPEGSYGYHRGRRDFTYNGLVYRPNKFLSMGDMQGAIGPEVTARELIFSNIPVPNTDDAINALEQFTYTNAPVIISHLSVNIETGEINGVLASYIYEINEVRYPKSARNKDGSRSLTIVIELEPPGRSARGATNVKRSTAEQQFDNDATDTGLEYVGINAKWPTQWGSQ